MPEMFSTKLVLFGLFASSVTSAHWITGQIDLRFIEALRILQNHSENYRCSFGYCENGYAYVSFIRSVYKSDVEQYFHSKLLQKETKCPRADWMGKYPKEK